MDIMKEIAKKVVFASYVEVKKTNVMVDKSIEAKIFAIAFAITFKPDLVEFVYE